MAEMVLVPDFDALSTFIAQKFDELRSPYMEWSNIARCFVQGLPYSVQRLVTVEAFINITRAELRKAVMIASEHFTEEQLDQLRYHARMSKQAWKSLKNRRPVSIPYGFSLVCY
jgi:hypothetical protein